MHNGMSMFRRDDDKLIITQDNLKQFDLFKTTWAKGNTKRKRIGGTPSIPLGRIPYGRDRGFHIGCKGTDCVTHSLNDVA